MVRIGVIMLDERTMIDDTVRTWMAGIDLVLIPSSSTGAEAAAYFDYIHGLFLHPGIAGKSPSAQQSALANTFLTMAAASKDYFPVWGTCQGFEQMISFISGITQLDLFDSKDYYKQVHGDVLTTGVKDSRILNWAPPQFLHQTYIPYFNHTEGISVRRFNQTKLKTTFRILTKAHDRAGHEYVAFIEGFTLPWYGCQFHPELHRPLSDTRWMVDFLLSEAKKSSHTGFDPRG
jgi:anthranilate/para-aminobenzoate synthase component II